MEEKTPYQKRKERLLEQQAQSGTIGAGKIPPQVPEIEEALLGTVMSYSNHLVMILDLFKSEIFYVDANVKIAKAILSLHKIRRNVDELTVVAELRRTGELEIVGGAYYVMTLLQKANVASLQEYVRLVNQAFLSRELIRMGSEMISGAYNGDDPFDQIMATQKRLDDLQQGTMTKSEVHISQLAIDAVNDRTNNPGKRENLGLSTGLKDLDGAIGGFQDDQLIIIGARPAMGKTAVALGVAKHIGMVMKEPVALFSLEMSAKQLYTRFQSQTSGIDSKKIKYNDLSDVEKKILFDADGDLSEAQIYIDETPALNIDVFRAKATIMKHKYGIKAIIIDYLQLMKGSKANSFNQEAEVSEISGKLKQVAKELGIPVIALSQLSREVEKRAGNKIPQLSDLRNSGSIEQDADVIIFLWRPAYYDVTDEIEFRHFNVSLSPKNLLAMVVAKQREGETMIIPVELNLSTMKLGDHPTLHSKFAPRESMPVSQTIMFPSNPGDIEDPDAPF